MANNRSEELEDLHNKGEQDCANDNYDPPRGVLRGAFDLFTTSSSEEEKRKEEDDAYSSGWENTWKQKH
jgi:hypothetical protein